MASRPTASTPLKSRPKGAAENPIAAEVEPLSTASEGGDESMVDRIVAQVREGIRRGNLVPGQRLVEADLTARFAVSRGPVREAMRRLMAEGVLVQAHHRGMVVRRLGREEVQSLFRVREALEGLAARCAAENLVRSGQKDTLKRLIKEMDAQVKHSRYAEFFQNNEHLHNLIMEMSANLELRRLVDQLNVHVFRLQLRSRVSTSASLRESHLDHVALVQAIANADPDAAEAAMRNHIQRSAALAAAMPDEAFG